MTKNYLYYLSAFLLFLLLNGCLDAGESDHEKQIRDDDETIQSYLESNNIEAEKLSSGVYAEVLKENENGKEVAEDHVVGILYTMTHLSGEHTIETHTDTLNPLRFSNSYNYNYNSIHPAGINYAIGLMREGEKYRFYVPSYQAFENYSHEDFFDSFSNFIIEVDLIELKTEEEIYYEEVEKIQNYISENEIDAESYPNGLYHVQIEENSGKIPNSSSQVQFHFTRKYLDGTVIETTVGDDPVQLYLNLGNNNLVEGLEEGILLMREGETAEFIMPSRLAFGKSVQVIPQQLRETWAENGEINPLTKPYSPVIYEIELLTVN